MTVEGEDSNTGATSAAHHEAQIYTSAWTFYQTWYVEVTWQTTKTETWRTL